jgi:hypothetical protein
MKLLGKWSREDRERDGSIILRRVLEKYSGR